MMTWAGTAARFGTGRKARIANDVRGRACLLAALGILLCGLRAASAQSIARGAQSPAAGTASAIVTGGTAVTLITGPVNGCYVTNPLSAADQNIGTAEVAYFNPVTTATLAGRGTNSTIQPGQSFSCPSGMTTNLSVNASTSGHAFTVVKW